MHTSRMYFPGLLVAVTGACAHASAPVSQRSIAAGAFFTVSADTIPGIPNQPDFVTVIPFAPLKPAGKDDVCGEAGGAITRVPIVADVNGRRALFILDMGSPHVNLDPTFFPVSPTGTDAEHREHIQLRIGTLLDQFEDSALADPALWTRPSHPVNAKRALVFDEEDCWAGVGPVKGIIGLSALEPFETIIDYAHRRLVLIRVDSLGHRLVEVPAYTPTWSAPLIDVYLQPGIQYDSHYWGVHGLLEGVNVSWIFDTGSPVTMISTDSAIAPLPDDSLDTDSLIIDGRPFHARVRRVKNPSTSPDIQFMLNILGYPFLRPFGVVGFNHRTHQVILYH